MLGYTESPKSNLSLETSSFSRDNTFYNSHIDHFNRQKIVGSEVLFRYMKKAQIQNLVKWLVCSHVVASLQVFMGNSNESFIPCNQLMVLFLKKNRREKHSFPALAFKVGGMWPHTFWVTRHRQYPGQFIVSLGTFHPLFLRHRLIIAVSIIGIWHNEPC